MQVAALTIQPTLVFKVNRYDPDAKASRIAAATLGSAGERETRGKAF